VFLPKFVIKGDTHSEDLSFERDLLSKVDWNGLDVDFVNDIPLSVASINSGTIKIGFSDKIGHEFLSVDSEQKTMVGSGDIDTLFVTRQLSSIIPNPWISYQIAQKCIDIFKTKHSDQNIALNLVYIINELMTGLQKQIDSQCQAIFRNMLADDTLRFVLLSSKGGFKLPKSIKTSGAPLPNPDSTSLAQLSLFDSIGEDDFNNFERNVAMYFEKQEKLLWWHRNVIGKTGYHVQGWGKGKIYADFVYTTKKNETDFNKVYILETKGDHLIGNNDTNYKQNIFELCNTTAIKKDWNELIQDDFEGKEVEFQLVSEEDWQVKVNNVFVSN
jgi:type III restriction enzyme